MNELNAFLRGGPVANLQHPLGMLFYVLGLLLIQVASVDAQTKAVDAREQEIRSIERRLVDVQVLIGTLKSLQATGEPVGTGTVPERAYEPVHFAAAGDQRIAELERELGSLRDRYRRLTGASSPMLPNGTTALRIAGVDPNMAARAMPDRPPAAGGWSGATTVSPSGRAPTTELLPGNAWQNQDDRYGGTALGRPYPEAGTRLPRHAPGGGNGFGGWSSGGNLAGLPRPPAGPSAATGGNPEAEYQFAYNLLLQQDYGAAQTAFEQFVGRYPRNPLAANAQYWLGETYYVRGNYKQAAVAFLEGYERYGDGNKGADSLLKLAISLAHLGKTGAACSSLGELSGRYPGAPRELLGRAEQERGRLRCRR